MEFLNISSNDNELIINIYDEDEKVVATGKRKIIIRYHTSQIFKLPNRRYLLFLSNDNTSKIIIVNPNLDDIIVNYDVKYKQYSINTHHPANIGHFIIYDESLRFYLLKINNDDTIDIKSIYETFNIDFTAIDSYIDSIVPVYDLLDHVKFIFPSDIDYDNIVILYNNDNILYKNKIYKLDDVHKVYMIKSDILINVNNEGLTILDLLNGHINKISLDVKISLYGENFNVIDNILQLVFTDSKNAIHRILFTNEAELLTYNLDIHKYWFIIDFNDEGILFHNNYISWDNKLIEFNNDISEMSDDKLKLLRLQIFNDLQLFPKGVNKIVNNYV